MTNSPDTIPLPSIEDTTILGEGKSETADAMDVLSELAFFLGVGSGDENTTADQYHKKILWGIDYHVYGVFRMCAATVERLSQRPNTTWGEVKAELLGLADDSKPDIETIRKWAEEA